MRRWFDSLIETSLTFTMHMPTTPIYSHSAGVAQDTGAAGIVKIVLQVQLLEGKLVWLVVRGTACLLLLLT